MYMQSSCLSVCLQGDGEGSPHVTIIHDALNINVQGSPVPWTVTSGDQDWRHGTSPYRDPPPVLTSVGYGKKAGGMHPTGRLSRPARF